jgi:hypothetical protein
VGVSATWVAVKGKDPSVVLSEFGLEPTGEIDELPLESPIAGVTLPGGWYILILDRYGHRLARDEIIERVSRDCDAFVVCEEEHVMASGAAHWTDGQQLWRVAHDPSGEDVYNLDVAGTAPEEFDVLRREKFAAQEREPQDPKLPVDHVYDVPLELAGAATGFSLLETEPEGGFSVLAEVSPPEKRRVWHFRR